jgi:hypothetical protein
MDIRLVMTNKVDTLDQHLQPPINLPEQLIHHTTLPL